MREERPALKQWAADAGGAVTSFPDAAAFGDVLVLAIGWEGVKNEIDLVGPANTAGKVVLDATNPLDFSDGTLRLAVSGEDSSGERV